MQTLCMAAACPAAVAPPPPPPARPTPTRASARCTPFAAFPAPRHLATLRASSAAGSGSWRLQQLPWRHSLAPRASSASGSSGEAPGPAPLALSSSDEAADTAAPPLSSASGASGSYDGAACSEGKEASGGVQIDLQLPRRSLLVQFSCNLCNGRSERLVNPIAWQKGMVIAQCQHCQAWHKLADAANLVEEIRYADLEDE